MVTDAVTYRLFGLDYFDSVLLTGEYQKRDIRRLEEDRGTKAKELHVVGCTYLDVFREKLRTMEAAGDGQAKEKTVLVAPSWGKNGILRRYGLRMLEPLARSSYHLIIRPHPQSLISEKETVERLRAALEPYRNVEWNFDADNLAALSRSDLMISDFSGVIFDYAFLFGRPVAYPAFEFDKRPYDASDIEEEAWVFRAVREIGECIDENNFSGIEKFLDEVIEKKKESGVIEKLKREAWMYPGEAGRRTVDALEAILGKR
jgi:CDP-glycerol glycerophosphotransferase (TagB/SpsB family)